MDLLVREVGGEGGRGHASVCVCVGKGVVGVLSGHGGYVQTHAKTQRQSISLYKMRIAEKKKRAGGRFGKKGGG
jgi:hypothetical protein